MGGGRGRWEVGVGGRAILPGSPLFSSPFAGELTVGKKMFCDQRCRMQEPHLAAKNLKPG